MHIQAFIYILVLYVVLPKHAVLLPKAASCQKIMTLKCNVALTAGKDQLGVAGNVMSPIS